MSSFTVTLATGQDAPYTDNDESYYSYSIEPNGVLVITQRDRHGTVTRTQRYSPAGWTCVREDHDNPPIGFDTYDDPDDPDD